MTLIDSHAATLWTAAELARRLGRPKGQIYRWTERHGQPTVRIGRTLLYRPSDVHAWLVENTVTVDTQRAA
jgi:excisionase family DNA binding protein